MGGKQCINEQIVDEKYLNLKNYVHIVKKKKIG